jgi:arabinan endo-1,5-alpha-L-arabinosidase
MKPDMSNYRAILFTLVTICASGSIVAADTNSPSVGMELLRVGSRDVRVHDPSTVVKCGDQYWTFYTGRGVPSYHSTNMVRWEAGPRVFQNAPTWSADAVPDNTNTYYWAPDVIHLGERYLLYYSISTFGKNVSAIGLVSAPTLDPDDPKFNWRDDGLVIQSFRTNQFNTIDPAVTLDAQGKLWMVFGSYWSGIKLIELNPKTGKRIVPDSPIYSLAHSDSIEASFIYRHDGFYYLFVNWGQCCRGVNSTYEIRVGRAEKITGPYLDQNGVDMLNGGGTLFLASQPPFVGPGHAGIYSENGNDWFSCHFYNGTRGGTSTLAVFPLDWKTNGWPEVRTTR